MEGKQGDTMTLAEAAAKLRVAPVTLAHMVKAGYIPGRKMGKLWRFSEAALEAWLAGGERK